MWKELRTIKTKYEGRLANCIIAGINNPSLHIGIYACDEDAYFQYRKLFEPIIKDLYDYDMKSEALIKHNMKIKELDWNKLERAKYCIKSIQVTASRNVQGYSFVPILDNKNKSEIENKLKKVIMEECESNVTVNSMSDLDKKTFLDEGLMFEKHPSLDDIVTLSKANEGCCIYYNTDLSQVAWINADDHVQYFVTSKVNPDLRMTCEKLFSRIQALESAVPMSHHKNLGYLTCNPANLGTALKIKVIVQLEKSADENVKLEILNNFCKPFGVTVKEVAQAMFEISLAKSFQLGKTESDIIAGFIDCVHELLKYEEKMVLRKEKVMEKQKEGMPQFDNVNTSLIRPFITPEIWEKYSTINTIFGHTLEDSIKPGIANHKIGLIATDADCYDKFEELFMNVIQVYHEDYRKVDFPLIPPDLKEFASTLKKFEPLKYLVDGYLIWEGNMIDKSFPAGFNKKSREEANSALLHFLSPLIEQYGLTSVGIEDTEEVKELVYFNDLMAEKSKITELSLDWPEHRSLFRDSTGKINVLTNVMNQITLAIAITPKDLTKSVLTYFEIFNELVLKQFKLWAFSETFGFYETVPSDIGNAFSIKVALRLPNVVKMDTYMPLATSKKVILNLDETIMCLSHKRKFKSPSQCILDVIEVASIVAREEMLIEIFSTELLKEHENLKTSKGITCNDILTTIDPYSQSILLIEGVESFTLFNKLYACALKKVTYGDFDLAVFDSKIAELVLNDLELPVISLDGIIELSRNFIGFPFPGFMKGEDRVNVTKSLFPILTSLEVL